MVGKLNQTHAGETPFADRPLAAARCFGDEGLSSTGLSAVALVLSAIVYVAARFAAR